MFPYVNMTNKKPSYEALTLDSPTINVPGSHWDALGYPEAHVPTSTPVFSVSASSESWDLISKRTSPPPPFRNFSPGRHGTHSVFWKDGAVIRVASLLFNYLFSPDAILAKIRLCFLVALNRRLLSNDSNLRRQTRTRRSVVFFSLRPVKQINK